MGLDPEIWDGALLTLFAHLMDIEADWYYVISTDNVFINSVAVSAHANMVRVYEYFLKNHGRRGLDGEGSTIIAVIHVTKDGEPMDNAYWNSEFIAFGDGAIAFTPLAGALDIVADEMTHGIIESTVDLEYRFQSGALDESFSDKFGAMVDNEDWLIGEDENPSGALRDLQNPQDWDQPAHMNDYRELELRVKGYRHLPTLRHALQADLGIKQLARMG